MGGKIRTVRNNIDHCVHLQLRFSVTKPPITALLTVSFVCVLEEQVLPYLWSSEWSSEIEGHWRRSRSFRPYICYHTGPDAKRRRNEQTSQKLADGQGTDVMAEPGAQDKESKKWDCGHIYNLSTIILAARRCNTRPERDAQQKQRVRHQGSGGGHPEIFHNVFNSQDVNRRCKSPKSLSETICTTELLFGAGIQTLGMPSQPGKTCERPSSRTSSSRDPKGRRDHSNLAKFQFASFVA